MTIRVIGAVPDGHASFLVMLRPTREDWPVAMTAAEAVGMAAHATWLGSHVAAGLCAFAGPVADLTYGISGWTGLSLSALEALLEQDPSYEQGLMDVEVTPWHFSMERASELRV